MANYPTHNKGGMGGSCCGKGRWAKTAVLKKAGKKSRRENAKKEIRDAQ